MSINDLERILGDKVADRTISADDADTVREFAAFLAEPELSQPGPLPMRILRRYQDLLCLTDEQLAQAERNRSTTGHSLQRKPPDGGGGHTPGVGWMCTGCKWRFSYDVPEERARTVWLADARHVRITGTRRGE
jgi:hypothetical protein